MWHTRSMSNTASTPRSRAREQTMRDIVRIGRAHLATEGAAALSLRAVARDLGVVSSAVYRYVESRDELLTLLVVDGYDELGDAVDAALAPIDRADHARPDGGDRPGGARVGAGRAGDVRPALRQPGARLRGPGRAHHRARHPGDPAPGRGVGGRLGGGGGRRSRTSRWARAGSSRDLARVRRELGITAPEALVARGMLVWAALFGCVSFEVFGQYGADTFTDPKDIFEHHLAALVETVGLQPS